jgi:hypothetical protein
MASGPSSWKSFLILVGTFPRMSIKFNEGHNILEGIFFEKTMFLLFHRDECKEKFLDIFCF